MDDEAVMPRPVRPPPKPKRQWLCRYTRKADDEWSYTIFPSRKETPEEVARELVDSYMGYDYTAVEVQLLDVDESKWQHFNVKLEVAA